MKIFPVDTKPYGITYGEWSIRWWKWLFSIPKPINPSIDTNGVNALTGQVEKNVIFLCQTIEGVHSIPHRRFLMQTGKSIFIPIINWISIMHEDGETDSELLKTAKKRMDLVGDLEMRINGEKIRDLKKYRFQSPFFQVSIPENNIIGLPSGIVRLFSDGYWILTEPIFNDVEISTFGSCTSGITKIGVNYSIETMDDPQ